MTSLCTRGGLGQILGKMSLEGLPGIELAVQRSGEVTIPQVFNRYVDMTLRDMAELG